eukprot:1157801-Pelagomonas_calceolata.AAC.3
MAFQHLDIRCPWLPCMLQHTHGHQLNKATPEWALQSRRGTKIVCCCMKCLTEVQHAYESLRALDLHQISVCSGIIQGTLAKIQSVRKEKRDSGTQAS